MKDPKEKAEELIGIFQRERFGYMSAKRCAIICCKEIIEAKTTYYFEDGTGHKKYKKPKYWPDVLKHLESNEN